MTEESMPWRNVQFDATLITAFMSCPREFNYKYVRHLRSIFGTKEAMEEGTLVHKAMEIYYGAIKDGYSKEQSQKLALIGAKEFAPTLENLKPEMALFIYDSLEKYFAYRYNDNFIVLAVEQAFKTVIYENEEERLRIIATGKIDLITRDKVTNLIIPYDHKKESEQWHYSNLANQFKIYALATGARTLVINRFGMQKSYGPDKRFQRDNLTFDEDTLEEFQYEVLPYYAKQMLKAFDEDYFPPNYASCIKGRMACQFSDKYNGGICNVSPEMREAKLMRFFRVEQAWDPNAD